MNFKEQGARNKELGGFDKLRCRHPLLLAPSSLRIENALRTGIKENHG